MVFDNKDQYLSLFDILHKLLTGNIFTQAILEDSLTCLLNFLHILDALKDTHN